MVTTRSGPAAWYRKFPKAIIWNWPEPLRVIPQVLSRPDVRHKLMIQAGAFERSIYVPTLDDPDHG